MKVMPTLEGGLKIDVETATDWLVLEQIPDDALEGGADRLPDRLGSLMGEDSDWDEVVVPWTSRLGYRFWGGMRRAYWRASGLKFA